MGCQRRACMQLQKAPDMAVVARLMTVWSSFVSVCSSPRLTIAFTRASDWRRELEMRSSGAQPAYL